MPEAPDSTDAPTPDAAPETRDEHAGGFTINLASGTAPGTRPRRNKKSAAPPPVVQKTINLSTPKSESEKASAKASSGGKGKPKRQRGGPKGTHKGGKPKGKKRPSSGTSLADMLDPEVLAKLRGD
ncbi:MAG: hypothetical protein AAGI52_13365 [Bacteroidota bacterium]